MDPLAIFTAIVVLIIILVLIYMFIIKPPVSGSVTVPTSTTNGYILENTVVPITKLPLTISGATYINYTNTVPFSVVGTSILNSVVTQINIPTTSSYTWTSSNNGETVSVVIGNVVPTSTTNGYISNGIIVSITGLPVTISGATYINYTDTVPFSVTGSVTNKGTLSQINVSNQKSYTLSGEYIIASLTANTVLTQISNPLTDSSSSIVSTNPATLNETPVVQASPVTSTPTIQASPVPATGPLTPSLSSLNSPTTMNGDVHPKTFVNSN